MKVTVQLEAKEIREIIARYLGVRVEDVIPNRYNFSVVGLSSEEIQARIEKGPA